MLKKSAGNALVQKLQVILLLTVDFNIIYKIIFNNRIIPSIEDKEVILMEIIRERKAQAATHLALDKKLISDIANARKVLLITICTDTSNCSNRVAHVFASACAKYFRVEILHLVILFRAIQSIKIFLHTSCCTS